MDNFDLKKFLKESKAIENLNPSIKAINEGEAAYEYEKGKKEGEKIEKKKMTKEAMKKQIKDMIVAELAEETAVDMMDPIEEGNDKEDEEDYSDYFFDIDTPEEDLEEAKKKKDEEVEDIEDIEDIEITDTDEEMPAEEAPTGGLKDIVADMKGTEGDLMDHLMKAFQIAKGMGNEKLETQVGNTLKFFVSEYIGGGED